MKRMAIFSILLLIFLSGCIDEEQPIIEKRTDVAETSPMPEKKLNWMGHWLVNHDRETLVREVAQDFELMNPDIDVNLKYPEQIMGVRSRDEGIKLLMFWSTPLVAEKWVRYAKAPTGLVGHLSTPDQADDVFEQFQAAITDKYGGNVHYSANAGYVFGEENRLLQDDLNELLIRLLDGEITAEQAYEKIIGVVE